MSQNDNREPHGRLLCDLAFTVKKEGGDNTDDVITLFDRLAALTTSLNYAGSVYAWVTSATTV